MAKQSGSEQLNQIVERLLGRPASVEARGFSPAERDVSVSRASALGVLADVARELHGLPRSEFKARLKADLEK